METQTLAPQAAVSSAPTAVTSQHRSVARNYPQSAVIRPWSARDGHRLHRLMWPQDKGDAARGSILFFGGRGDFFEKYLETLDCWHRAGWGIEAFDWRGQGGSGRMLDDPLIGHIDDFSIWIDDLRAFVADWETRTPAPHVIVGHSMGGHLLARALAEGAVRPNAAVMIAPMMGFRNPMPNWFGLRVARSFTSLGLGERAAWRESEKPGTHMYDRMLLLTHDKDRYDDELFWHTAKPDTKMGPASWHWVERAYESMVGLEQPGVLEAIDTPVLMLIAEADKLVSPTAATRAIARMPHGESVRFGSEAAHELLREVDAVRDRALAKIDAFLHRAAPVGAASDSRSSQQPA